MQTLLIYIWNNFKTTIASIIGLFTVYALWRGWIIQDTAELIAGITAIVWTMANIIMTKR